METPKDDPVKAPIAALIEGARAFRRIEYLGRRDVMPRLAAAQHPDVMMIGCADSRVDPAVICGAGPGEVFLIRNIANLVPAHDVGDGRGDSVRAAVEYGVKVLGVSHIVVLGHSNCGGIGALIDTACGVPPELDLIGSWLELAGGICDQVLAELAGDGEQDLTADGLRARAALVERRSVLSSVDNLRTYPWVRDKAEAGTLALHGWWFDLHDGCLWTAHPATGTFEPIEAA